MEILQLGIVSLIALNIKAVENGEMGKKRLVGGVSFFVYSWGCFMPEKNLVAVGHEKTPDGLKPLRRTAINPGYPYG